MENAYNLFLSENESNVTALDDLLKSPIKYPWEEAVEADDGRDDFGRLKFTNLDDFLGNASTQEDESLEQGLPGEEPINILDISTDNLSSTAETDVPDNEPSLESISFKVSDGAYQPSIMPEGYIDDKLNESPFHQKSPETTPNDEVVSISKAVSSSPSFPPITDSDGDMEDAIILRDIQAVLSYPVVMSNKKAEKGTNGWELAASYPLEEGGFCRNGQRKEVQKPPTTAGITLDDLKAVFHMERPKAEKKLRLKRTTFSNLSRYYGISKWPFRTIRDALNRIKANEKLLTSGDISKDKHRKITEQQRLLQGVIRLIYHDPRESRDSNTLAVLLRIVAAREGSSKFCDL